MSIDFWSCVVKVWFSFSVLETVLFPAVIFQLMLREAHEAIADKDSLIEDNERMTKFLKEEKDEFARENQVRVDPVRIIRGSVSKTLV